jgi:S-adenosylmethionine:tRNA ribosyltransferase-isomerase
MNKADINKVKLSDFNYELPEKNIAQEPMEQRDASKLLVYRNSQVSHEKFKDLDQFLTPNQHLVLNNAKVIPARLYFYRSSGAKIEIFLLEPLTPFTVMDRALMAKHKVTWQCMVGNLKRWKPEEILTLILPGNPLETKLNAKLISKESQIVELSWNTEESFSEILEKSGKTPLPPYIKRESEEKDEQSYQTVFAKEAGAVAAPTAGLHFSEDVFNKLQTKGIKISELTLYVGAGTFAPVNTEFMVDHNMHSEMISVKRHWIKEVLNATEIVAVGTTSLRTMESLYWMGVKLSTKTNDPFKLEKLFPYTFLKPPLTWKESLCCLLNYMESHDIEVLQGSTALMILPGYTFMSCITLITNFHFPSTTLIMLVAAFIGDDWKKVYEEALQNNYRFLSYGDSSLLIRADI